MSEKINVLLIEPGKYPKQIEIEDTLEAMQETVGGYIERTFILVRLSLLHSPFCNI